MLSLPRTTARYTCSRRQQLVLRPVCASGWPNLKSLWQPPAATVAPMMRSDAFYSGPAMGPTRGTSAAAAAAGSAGASASGAQQQQQQQQAHFRLHRISGDGACMFRAIAQGAQQATHGKSMSADSEGVAAQNLRQAVVQELRKRRDEIEPFLPGIAPDFDEYCRTMSHPMAWGGEPEMVMAVHVVRRPITVYHVQDGQLVPIVTYGDHLLGTTEPIHLLWSGAHYDLLVPEQNRPNGAAAA